MLLHQRQWAQGKFRELLADKVGAEFEKFFHTLMELSHADYMPVRTHGDIGDLSADGIGLCGSKLFACYAPETVNPAKVRSKFHGDLNGALTKRNGQFSTFVFVHNDQRGGIHPVVAGLIAETAMSMPDISFEQMGPQKLWYEAMGLDAMRMSELLGVPEIPVTEVRYRIGMAELDPLLDHLRTLRSESHEPPSLAPPPSTKLAYNALSSDYATTVRQGIVYSEIIDQYYSALNDPTEHDEVAAGFSAYYGQMRAEHPEDPDSILWQMQMYVLGNHHARPDRLAAANAVISHFFERCDIFERPPDGWEPTTTSGGR